MTRSQTGTSAAVQRVMQSPVYLLLSGVPAIQRLLRDNIIPLPVLAAVSEDRWLNLLGENVTEDLSNGRAKLPQVLASKPQWQIDEPHYEALRLPEMRQLIHEGIFTFDRFVRMNGRQIQALVASRDLTSQLLSRKMTAPHFLRYSPSQLSAHLADLDTPKAAL